MTDAFNLEAQFGAIDIYLFDQLLRRRLTPPMRTLDAGCGGGRNLVYLLRAGFEVCATDADPRAVDSVRRLAASLAPALPQTNFRVEPVERCSFPDASFDAVISSAVLHFSTDDEHFAAMVGLAGGEDGAREVGPAEKGARLQAATIERRAKSCLVNRRASRQPQVLEAGEPVISCPADLVDRVVSGEVAEGPDVRRAPQAER